MHDSRRLQIRPRRLLASVVIAVCLAGAAVIVRPVGWSPICEALHPDTNDADAILWVLYGCWIDPPPKDPRA